MLSMPSFPLPMEKSEPSEQQLIRTYAIAVAKNSYLCCDLSYAIY